MRALTGLLLLLTAASAAAAELREMRLMDGPEATRAVFDFDVATTPKLFTLANPDRVVIDFADARRGPGMPAASAGKGLVKSVRTGPRETGLRVVLDVGEKVAPQSFGLEASEGYGYRLIVDLMPKQPHRAALPAPSAVPATTPVPAAAPAAPKPELVVAAASATAAAAVAAAPLPLSLIHI